MGRDFIPLYQIYADRPWEEMVGKLGNLPLFKEAAVICTGQERLGVNRSRRAPAFSRQYAEPVPIAERRTTPYALTNFFRKSSTFDNLFNGPGLPETPVFVALREDRPAHCLEASYPLADTNGYVRWCAKRPNYLGVRTLGEYDNDSKIYADARIENPETRANLHAAFPPLPPQTQPFARRRAWRAWAKTAFERERAFHFGERRLWPLMCASPGLAHIWAAQGVPGFVYEATMQCATVGPIVTPFVRGAARQFSLPFTWYMANYNNAFTRAGEYGPGANDMRGPKAYRSHPELGPRPYRGASRSFLARLAAWGWLNGATFFENEGWQGFHIDDRDGGDWKPSFYARDLDDLYALSKTVDRGTVYAPIALLVPMLERFEYNGNTMNAAVDPWAQTAFYYTLQPVRSEDILFREMRRRGVEGYFFPSPIGSVWDVLVPDSGQPTDAFAKALSGYRCAILVSKGFERGTVDQRALEAFVRDGGTLIVSCDQVVDGIVPEAFAGVRFGEGTAVAGQKVADARGRPFGTLEEAYRLALPASAGAARPFLSDERGQIVAFARDAGKGRVVTFTVPRILPAEWQKTDLKQKAYEANLAKIMSGEKRFSLIRALVSRLQDETLPIVVSGDVSFGLNRTHDGWLVWLMNANGVTKFVGEQQTLDEAKSAAVTVSLKGVLKGATVADAQTGEVINVKDEAFLVNVGPGAWRILNVRERKR